MRRGCAIGTASLPILIVTLRQTTNADAPGKGTAGLGEQRFQPGELLWQIDGRHSSWTNTRGEALRARRKLIPPVVHG